MAGAGFMAEEPWRATRRPEWKLPPRLAHHRGHRGKASCGGSAASATPPAAMCVSLPNTRKGRGLAWLGDRRQRHKV